ncbi:MAG: riboflavin biosynthesis protein RibF [Acidobacteriota bacterium]
MSAIMQIVEDALRSADLPYGVVATIGNYDGLHRGQRTVLDTVVERAEALGCDAVVVSFEPHPLRILRPEQAPPLLTPPAVRERLLREIGIDVLLLVRFNRELGSTPAERFVRDFLHRKLSVRELYVGADFGFGHRREGNVALLERLGEELGFQASGIEPLRAAGEVISATRIRGLIPLGEVAEARRLLGYPYTLRGVVVRGDRMGTKLGWPTINLDPENDLLPADGVYAAQAFFPSFPATFDCVTNVGRRPTLYETHQLVVESHVLDFNADVYGEEVEVRFFQRLREEKMFSTPMDLAAQIGRDVEATREYFATRRRLNEMPELT